MGHKMRAFLILLLWGGAAISAFAQTSEEITMLQAQAIILLIHF